MPRPGDDHDLVAGQQPLPVRSPQEQEIEVAGQLTGGVLLHPGVERDPAKQRRMLPQQRCAGAVVAEDQRAWVGGRERRGHVDGPLRDLAAELAIRGPRQHDQAGHCQPGQRTWQRPPEARAER